MILGQFNRLIMIFFVISNLFCSAYGLFFGQKQPTLIERIINGIVSSTMNTIDYGRFIVTNRPMEMFIALCIITVIVILFKLFKKGRHSTPNPTNFNVFNTMQLESSRNHTSVYGENRNFNVDSRSIKVPEVFKEGMDLKSWFILMKIYLKNFPKCEWLEVAISYIENKVLRKVKNLEELICTRSYDDFKTKLFDALTVKPREISVKLERLTDYKQSQKDSIRDYGESIVNMLKKLFPNVNNSNDIDSIIQECFVNGLLNQKLREAVRLKMLKMKNIKKYESFKINDLINYAECKNFDSDYHSDKSLSACENESYSNQFRNTNRSFHNQNGNQNYHQNFATLQNSQKKVEFQTEKKLENQRINYLSHVPRNNSVLNFNEPIIGQALFNNTLVNYMCDSGADITVINFKTFLLIKRHEPSTILEEYHGVKLYSASGEIEIFGLVRLKRCLIVPGVQLKNTNILVTNYLGHQCLLGRDIIKRIPDLKKRIDSIKTIYQEYSLRVVNIFRKEMANRRLRNKYFHFEENNKNKKFVSVVWQRVEEKEIQYDKPFLNKNKTKIKNDKLIINNKKKVIVNQNLQTNQCYSVAKDINFNKSKLIKTDSDTNVKPIQNGKFMYGFNNFHKQKNVCCSNLRYAQETNCANCPNISLWKKRKEKLNAKLAINLSKLSLINSTGRDIINENNKKMVLYFNQPRAEINGNSFKKKRAKATVMMVLTKLAILSSCVRNS
ncbi:unnamed protein product [Brachionus calyciflorus]|uniref:Peptidase A2 domain-containing protein n=1 Tax=Brachionus calyciflorus TaxID=104777 RepID=A0A813RM86_9BILA|nr:unnamed protein product [Brachionus calyciflorus]